MADPTAPSDEGTRADILRWAAHQLRQVPIECTALTGPVWYGAGWKDATDHLEDLADGETHTPGDHDEQSPLYERIAAAALTVPIRLGPATIRNAQAGQNVTRLSGSEADHVAQVVMDVLANRADTPGEGNDPRTEVEAHWGGEPEQLIAVWEADRVQWRSRVRELEEKNQRLRKQSAQRWTAWRSACARAKEARENEQMERYFAREFGGDVIRLRRQLTQTGDWQDAYNELCSRLAFDLGMVNPTVAGDHQVEERVRDLKADAATAREAGRREGMAEVIAHLDDVAAGARAGKAAAHPERAERMGPTRWCLVTGTAYWLASQYAAGEGLPVPDATARVKGLEAELRREQGRHASEVVNLREEAADWKRCYAARERWAHQLQAELHDLKKTSRRRELTLVDRLRRRGEHLNRVRTNHTLAELGLAHLAGLLDCATRFQVGPAAITPHRQGWRCAWPDPAWPGDLDQAPALTEDFPDLLGAIIHADNLQASDRT